MVTPPSTPNPPFKAFGQSNVSKGDDNLVYPQWEEPMEKMLESVRPVLQPAAEFCAAIGVVLLTMFVFVEFYRTALPLYFRVAAWSTETLLSMFF